MVSFWHIVPCLIAFGINSNCDHTSVYMCTYEMKQFDSCQDKWPIIVKNKGINLRFQQVCWAPTYALLSHKRIKATFTIHISVEVTSKAFFSIMIMLHIDPSIISGTVGIDQTIIYSTFLTLTLGLVMDFFGRAMGPSPFWPFSIHFSGFL